MFNQKWYQASKSKMEFHMINMIYAPLSMRAQIEKTTFSCKDDCIWIKHTLCWTYNPHCASTMTFVVLVLYKESKKFQKNSRFLPVPIAVITTLNKNIYLLGLKKRKKKLWIFFTPCKNNLVSGIWECKDIDKNIGLWVFYYNFFMNHNKPLKLDTKKTNVCVNMRASSFNITININVILNTDINIILTPYTNNLINNLKSFDF